MRTAGSDARSMTRILVAVTLLSQGAQAHAQQSATPAKREPDVIYVPTPPDLFETDLRDATVSRCICYRH